MSGWTKKSFVSPGRHVKAEIERSPVSWWMEARCQSDRASFYAKVEIEAPRIQARGLCPDKYWKDQ